MMALDRLLPDYHFHERHALHVNAPPAAVYQAVREVTPGEIPLIKLLFWLRALPGRLIGRRFRALPHNAGPIRAGTTILDGALRSGFVLLHDDPERQVVVGTIGKFWQVSGGTCNVPDAASFLSFADPTFARAAMDFRLQPDPTGGARLSTETRVQIPDPDARRRFGRYWSVVHPGSALIRRLWLQAVKKRAERSIP